MVKNVFITPKPEKKGKRHINLPKYCKSGYKK